MTTIHRLSTGALLALAFAASAAPASAMPNQFSPGGASVVRVPDGAHAVAPPPAARTRAGVEAARAAAPVPTPATIVRLTPSNNGFDWGDAGIGAAAVLALSFVGLGGARAVSHRHGHQTAA